MFILALLLIVLPESAKASRCLEQTLDQQFETADFVFTAMVLSTKLAGRNRTEAHEDKSIDWSSMDEVEVYFDPIENFKGDSSELKHVTTYVLSAPGGTTIFPGQTWAFFVLKNGHLSLCGGSQKTNVSGYMPRSLRIYRDILMLKGYNKSLNADTSNAGAG